MLQPDKLFENFFNDKEITSTRFSNFTTDCINRLTAQNGTNEYTALITLLEAPSAALQSELEEVDTALGIQKGATLTLDGLIKSFKDTMRD